MDKIEGYSRSDLGDIIEIVEAHRTEWLVAWRDFFAGP